MANIWDYLKWRGDVPFEIDPFNEVDALVLCELVYAPFDDLVPPPGVKDKIGVEELCEKIFERHSKEELMAKSSMTKMAPFLLPEMVGSRRYGDMKLAGFVNDIDTDNQSQFAVCTFYMSDGTIFVAFRGTDDTLVGWKEDFNMCFSEGTGGQIKAVDYLNTNFATTMKKIRIGGHSKGGNFAEYGAAFCQIQIKDSITHVYNFDGPGFIPEILRKNEYKTVVNHVHKYIPQESIIGLLMNTKAKTSVVLSNSKGIYQHDPLTWQIVRNKMERVETVTSSALMIDETIKKWTVNFDYETRALFGDIFFASLESNGATMLSELTSNRLRSVAQITKEIQSLDPEKQAVVMDVLGKLVASGGDSLKNSLLSILPKNVKLRKIEKKREK